MHLQSDLSRRFSRIMKNRKKGFPSAESEEVFGDVVGNLLRCVETVHYIWLSGEAHTLSLLFSLNRTLHR